MACRCRAERVSLPFLHLLPSRFRSLTRQKTASFSSLQVIFCWFGELNQSSERRGRGPGLELGGVGISGLVAKSASPPFISVAVFDEEAAWPLNQQLPDPETCSSLLSCTRRWLEEPPRTGLSVSVITPKAFDSRAEWDPCTHL